MLLDTERPTTTRPRRRTERREVVPVLLVTLLVAAALAGVFTLLPTPDVGTSGDFTVVERDGGGTPSTAASVDVVPDVQSRAYAVLDLRSGALLSGRDVHARLPVGSLMKLLTAWVVMQAGQPDKAVTVPDMDIAADESSIHLRPGEQQRRDVLMRSMLIVSANDAARALAVDVAGSEATFVDEMNTAARELGLGDTRAANPVGLDAAGQFSSAHDVAQLGARLMQDPVFRATVQKREARLHGEVYPTTNDLLGSYAGADGIKTGHTDDAGWCLLASATRDGRSYLAVVLGAPDEKTRNQDATKLLDWAFAQ